MKTTRSKTSSPSRPTISKLPAVYRQAETNSFLKQEKASILKKFDFRQRSVCRQRDLAICLIALGRNKGALQILDCAHTNVAFRGSYGVWYAAASACCISSYLRRKKGQHKRATLDFQRFLEPPWHGILFQPDVWTAAFVRKHIAGEREQFAPWFDSPDLSGAIEARAWWIATLLDFRELALNGFPRKGKVSVTRLDSWIESAFAELRNKLHEVSGHAVGEASSDL